jgi:Short C-terminal domain
MEANGMIKLRRASAAILLISLLAVLSGCCCWGYGGGGSKTREKKPVVVGAPSGAGTGPTVGQQLESLEEAHKKGIISKDQYEEAKKKLLEGAGK